MRIALCNVIMCASLCAFAPWAQAESLFGEFRRLPNTIERGFTSGADFGPLLLYGSAVNKGFPGRTLVNPGFQLSFNFGYDIFKYLSLENINTIGISQADSNDPILTGGVNTFLFDLAAKLQMPFERWNPFILLGGGLTYTRPLFQAGQNWTPNMLFGLGMEYYTYLRHFSLYAKVTYIYMKELPINAIAPVIGLKYTF